MRRAYSSSCIVGAMKPARAGREIKRIVVAYEAGRDGFWLARWLRARAMSRLMSSIPRALRWPREHRRAKTDRLDTELPDARLSRLVAWREAPLQHGCHPDDRGGGREATEPRAAKSCHRANADREPNEGHLRALRHSRSSGQTLRKVEGKLKDLRTAEVVSVAGEHARGTVPPSGATTRSARPDPQRSSRNACASSLRLLL